MSSPRRPSGDRRAGGRRTGRSQGGAVGVVLVALALPALAATGVQSGGGPVEAADAVVDAVTGGDAVGDGASGDVARAAPGGALADDGPDGPTAAEGEAASDEAGALATRAETVSRYEVRAGDTLSRIAVLHALPQAALADHNDLHPPYELRPGERLAIPAPAGDRPPPPDPGAPESTKVETSISRWADANDLPPSLLAAMTWHESRWRRDARSEKGAIGVGQVLPTTATWVADELIGEPLDPWAIDDNVQLSAHYLRWLIDRADGDHAAALAAYYQGEASLAEIGWYDDTDDYVAAVFDLRWRYRDAKS